ncbi:hypothetical protein ACFV6U_37250, partial [Streptomyces sp. NPDC059810]|uniref:hypothetical protein n=1 Tax=Streptomyces sp. NPDC059810 TaxID=3346956 RepID=UPI0036616B16
MARRALNFTPRTEPGPEAAGDEDVTAAALALVGPRRDTETDPDVLDAEVVEDQDDEAGGFAMDLVDGGGRKADPFAPRPLDPDKVTGTPAERLAIVEDALRAAKLAHDGSERAARNRFVIEAGAAYEILVVDDLYKARGYASLDAYAGDVLKVSRDQVYKTIDAANALRPVLASARLSKIFDSPPNASQAKAIAPVLAFVGEEQAAEVVTAVKTSGKKVTAAALTAQVKRLGYARPAPGQDRAVEDQAAVEEHRRAIEAGRKLTAAADLVARARALYEEAVREDVAPVDLGAATTDVHRMARDARILGKQTRVPGVKTPTTPDSGGAGGGPAPPATPTRAGARARAAA